MKRFNANQIVALVLGVLSLAYLYAAYQIPTFPIPRPIDSDRLPKLLGFIMVGLAAWLFLERPEGAHGADSDDRQRALARWMPVIVTSVAIAAYAALLQPLGFVLASFVLAAGLTWYYGYRRHLVNACVALAVPLVLYLVMTRLMTIHLPRGVLPF